MQLNKTKNKWLKAKKTKSKKWIKKHTSSSAARVFLSKNLPLFLLLFCGTFFSETSKPLVDGDESFGNVDDSELLLPFAKILELLISLLKFITLQVGHEISDI